MTKLLDCTIRDGGYVNRWHFSDECVTDIITTLDKCGYDFVEIGFRHKPEIYNNGLCGKWRYCIEEDIEKVVPLSSERNIKISVMVDYKSTSIDLFPDVNDTVIDMVRVAFHIPELESSLELCKQLKQRGYIVCANAMATMNYTDELFDKLCKLAHDANIDYLYLADSYGCLTPDDLNKMIRNMSLKLPVPSTVKLGLHAHNNIQNGLANFLSVNKESGIKIVDSTMLGMGRGAGNLCTELVIQSDSRFQPNQLLAACQFAEKHILRMYSDKPTEWGYNLPFVISAYFKCHPNYILKLKDYGITSVTDVWKYIKGVHCANKHKMFDLDYLNSIVSIETVHSN